MHALRRTPAIPLFVAALTVAALTVAYSLAASGDSDARGFAIASAVAIIATAIVFGPVRARAESGADRGRRTAWWLAGLSVLTLPVFWMGIPAVLGGGAAVIGRESRNTPAMVIGALAFVIAIGSELFA
jgi:hypothetical protein